MFNKLNELKALKGRKAKLAFLQANKDDSQLKEILQWALDPKIVFGMKPKGVPEELPLVGILSDKFDYVKSRLRDIAMRHVTGHAARDTLNHALVALNRTEREWLIKIVNKKLGLRFSRETCLKVWPDFCEVFNPMGAHVWDQKSLPFSQTILEFKIDGLKALAVNTSSRCVIKSRSGNIFGHLKFLADQIHEVLGNQEVVLDAEIFFKDWNTTMHLVNSSKPTQAERAQLRFIWFDMLPLTEFNGGESSAPLHQRKADMMMASALNSISAIEMNQWTLIESLSDIDNWFAIAISLGYEGLMLKNANAKYQCKRSNDMLKYKPFKDIDIKVTGRNEGRHSLIGTLGSLEVLYNDKIVAVGSGFSLPERREIWLMGDDIIDKVIECKIQDGRSNAGEFMTFKRLRSDKDEIQ